MQSGVNMGIYSLSYKNLRRNWLRNAGAVLRIAFGVIIFLTLISSGIGITTFLGQNQMLTDNSVSNQSNNNNTSISTITSTINDYLNSKLGINISNSQFLSLVETILRNVINFFDLIASIVFLVGIFGIFNAMTLNMLERKREIMLLKSLGFTEYQIILSHLLEAGVLGFIGALIGTAVGVLGITILSSVIKIIQLSILIPWWLPILAIILTTSLSILLPAYIVFYGVKDDAMEDLRYG